MFGIGMPELIVVLIIILVSVKLTLHFASPDELQGLLQRLGIQL